ncbi:MAG TPA: hypothetical protein VGD43_06625 [Micromonospora sp.]
MTSIVLTSIIGASVVALTAAVILGWRAFKQSRRPVTRAEKLRAARRAGQAIKRRSPRAHRDTFERGHGIGDRHSGAFLENSTYGDAANWSDSGDSSSGSY